MSDSRTIWCTRSYRGQEIHRWSPRSAYNRACKKRVEAYTVLPRNPVIKKEYGLRVGELRAGPRWQRRRRCRRVGA